MGDFTSDLDEITGGYNPGHYLDDDEFAHAVFLMVGRGHSASRAVDAIREWIAAAPMWECPGCGKTLDEVYAECPSCETANPSVVWESHVSPSE